MDAIGIILVIILSLWSITKTLEKLTDKILTSQNKQTELLEEIKARLDDKVDK
ncbi:hypothetical protein [Bacillus alkalicellulosilyticus]|uniref:hypothetical protein n=1 Tax=Alkalihalobacterium alkalicellulosilyticum TaxID=1912214 RepID=UPI00148392D7|nr:hypothetical protein [Bacillus alkalicellulosilyticus]